MVSLLYEMGTDVSVELGMFPPHWHHPAPLTPLLHCPPPSNAEQVLHDFLPYIQKVGGCREEPFELRNNCWLLASLCVHQRTAVCSMDVPREAPNWQRAMSCVHGGMPSKGNTMSTQQCQICRAVPMPLPTHCFSCPQTACWLW